jgi:hypothetical protein
MKARPIMIASIYIDGEKYTPAKPIKKSGTYKPMKNKRFHPVA